MHIVQNDETAKQTKRVFVPSYSIFGKERQKKRRAVQYMWKPRMRVNIYIIYLYEGHGNSEHQHVWHRELHLFVSFLLQVSFLNFVFHSGLHMGEEGL